MKLIIQIDLTSLPEGHTEPNELGVMLGELRNWVERLDDRIKEPTGRKQVRNFESEVIGFAQIVE
jgi:hypothetical protein